MKTKFLIILAAFFAPFFTLIMSADETKHYQEIPLEIYYDGDQNRDCRNMVMTSIKCSYSNIMHGIVTTMQSNLGDVTLTVTNCSTGSVWHSSFDSAIEPHIFLAISGEPGIYEIIYVTESGDVFRGTFAIYQ